MDHIEEIKTRLPIEDFISDYVQLKKSGRNFKGLSPFKQEKTPSFIVSPDKGIAYCFATQKGGDIFSMFQLLENTDFAEAVQVLAERTGVVLPQRQEKLKEQSDLKKSIQEVLETSLQFYQEEFKKSEEAQNYWKTRNIDEETSKDFNIGFAAESFYSVFKHLKSQGLQTDAMTASGMVIEKDEQPGEFFDRFRKRIMIPIYNHFGKIVGFGGRVIDNKDVKAAKYLNSPESILYNKSHILFGLDKAKEAIKQEGNVIILEGYMDVIASHQAGVKNVVAVSGTALTIDQLKLLKRYTKVLKLCFDQDTAGKEATKRSIELAAEQDFHIEIIHFTEAKDADELIQNSNKNRDKDLNKDREIHSENETNSTDNNVWKEAINNTISSLDFFFHEAEARYDIKDLNQQKLLVQEILQRIQGFHNVVIQQNYTRKLAEKCNIDPKLLLQELKDVSHKTSRKQKTEQKDDYQLQKTETEEYLLGIIFHDEKYIQILQKKLILQILQHEETKNIYKQLLDAYNTTDFSFSSFLQTLPENIQHNISIWQLFAEEKNSYCDEKEWGEEFISIIKGVNSENIKKVEKQLIQQMKNESDKQEQQKLALRLIEINKLNKIL